MNRDRDKEVKRHQATQRIVFIVSALLLLLTSRAVQARDVSALKEPAASPGSVAGVEKVASYSSLKLRLMLWLAHLPEPVEVHSGIELYRVRYWTQLDGKALVASGLMAVPRTALRGAATRGTVMYFHGTSPFRGDSPSAPALPEGVLPAAVFAAGGYILLAPDYLGLGQSHVMHPYLVASATTSAATDFLTAAYRVEADLKIRQNPDLYLTGFSEGGYAVAVVQRELESKAHPEVHLCAAASVSGAFDISSIAIPYAIEHDHSLYLSYLGTAYSTYYHQPLSSLFVERYASSLPALFDGDHQLNAIVAALPSNPRDLFVPEILRKLEAGGPNWFSDAAQQNQAFAWIPKAPLRLYFGSADTDVSPQEDRNFYDYAKPRGGAVVLEPLGPFQHTESAYHGIPKIRVWFDSLSN